MCGWHVHMQIICEQCPDLTCRENHQHRLSCKSLHDPEMKKIQHSYHKFHSITNSCHSKDSSGPCWPSVAVQRHIEWCADDMCVWRQYAETKLQVIRYIRNVKDTITNNVYMCVQHVDGIDNVCLCKQCMEIKLYIIGSIKSSRDDI